MIKKYGLKALRPLLSLGLENLPILASFYPYETQYEPWLIRWIATAEGFWLQVNDNYQGSSSTLTMSEFENLSGFNRDDLEPSYLENVGYKYGLPGGQPMLPLPFTVAELIDFDTRLGGAIRANFICIDTDENQQLAELEQVNADAAELARIIFSGERLPGPAQNTVTPAPVVAVNDGPAKPAAPAWSVKTSIKRWPGYRSPLYKFLQTIHVAGEICPKAQDVLNAWKLAPPPGLRVISTKRHDGLEYELNNGQKKIADLKAIQASIDALVIQID